MSYYLVFFHVIFVFDMEGEIEGRGEFRLQNESEKTLWKYSPLSDAAISLMKMRGLHDDITETNVVFHGKKLAFSVSYVPCMWKHQLRSEFRQHVLH